MIITVVMIVYMLPALAASFGKLVQLMRVSVCAAMSRPLRTLRVLLLHMGPLRIVYADKVDWPTYAFIGAFFGFALIAYFVRKIMQP